MPLEHRVTSEASIYSGPRLSKCDSCDAIMNAMNSGILFASLALFNSSTIHVYGSNLRIKLPQTHVYASFLYTRVRIKGSRVNSRGWFLTKSSSCLKHFKGEFLYWANAKRMREPQEGDSNPDSEIDGSRWLAVRHLVALWSKWLDLHRTLPFASGTEHNRTDRTHQMRSLETFRAYGVWPMRKTVAPMNDVPTYIVKK